MSTFAFSTLYTNILHHKLEEFINFCFNVDDEEFIGITRYSAIYTNSPENYWLHFKKVRLKLAISYLLGNSYFTKSDMHFHLLTRIPVGSSLFCVIIDKDGFFNQKTRPEKNF